MLEALDPAILIPCGLHEACCCMVHHLSPHYPRRSDFLQQQDAAPCAGTPVQKEELDSSAQHIPLMDEEHNDTDSSVDKVCRFCPPLWLTIIFYLDATYSIRAREGCSQSLPPLGCHDETSGWHLQRSMLIAPSLCGKTPASSNALGFLAQRS